MSTKGYQAEQIVTVLRQIEVEIANGKTIPQACREAQITAQTYYLPAAGRSLAEGIRRTEAEPGETAAGAGEGERPELGDAIRARAHGGGNGRRRAGRHRLRRPVAVAELERSFIAERVRAGLRNARAKGKRLGRPRKPVDRSRIASLRRTGASWVQITRRGMRGPRDRFNTPSRVCPKTLLHSGLQLPDSTLTKVRKSDCLGRFVLGKRHLLLISLLTSELPK